MKELTEAPAVSAFRARFEAGRSFDLDDDLEFCPGLLTEDDVSIHRHADSTFQRRYECDSRSISLTRLGNLATFYPFLIF